MKFFPPASSEITTTLKFLIWNLIWPDMFQNSEHLSEKCVCHILCNITSKHRKGTATKVIPIFVENLQILICILSFLLVRFYRVRKRLGPGTDMLIWNPVIYIWYPFHSHCKPLAFSFTKMKMYLKWKLKQCVSRSKCKIDLLVKLC